MPAIDGICKCKDGTYFDKIAQKCQACHPDCLTCDGSEATNCLSCPSLSQKYNIETTNCDCKEGYYQDIINLDSCKECHFNCFDCIGPLPSQCTQCRGNSILQAIDVSEEGLSIGFCHCQEGSFHTGNGYCSGNYW